MASAQQSGCLSGDVSAILKNMYAARFRYIEEHKILQQRRAEEDRVRQLRYIQEDLEFCKYTIENAGEFGLGQEMDEMIAQYMQSLAEAQNDAATPTRKRSAEADDDDNNSGCPAAKRSRQE